MSRAEGSVPRIVESNLPLADAEDVIDRLYAELSTLYEQKEAAPTDRRLDDRIERTFLRLRAAQSDEALRWRRFFEANLRMPLGAGAELLERVRQMRASDEDPAAGHPPSSTTYDPET